jgi:heptosyltransferase-1
MQRILLVKTSSLGDVVHNLPVASDIAAAFPGAAIDWVVEESIAALPALHASVRHTIPVAVRRWRKRAWTRDTWREIGSFVERLRAERYDAVIDSQGLFKSAFITRAARGPRYGLDWRASREPLFPFYNHTFHVPRSVHAVDRNRRLAANALGYRESTTIEYGIEAPMSESTLFGAQYAVLLHATSARSKLWPQEHWSELGRALLEYGVRSVLPWGSETERVRSHAVAKNIPQALVPPPMGVREIASLLGAARYVIGVDTGLTHLAGAFGVPTVGVYVATDPSRTGLRGCARAVNLGGKAQQPRPEDVLQALRHLSG